MGYLCRVPRKVVEAEKGVGNLHDYGVRWYDASIGRFTTIDPLASDFSFQSPYAYATNNPVLLRDIMGMGVEDIIYIDLKGDEVGRIKDDKRNYIVIVDTKPVDGHQTNWPMAGTNSSPTDAPAYDMKSVDALYDRSRNDPLPDDRSDVNSTVYAEHGNAGYLKGGVVSVGEAPDKAPGYPNMVGASNEGDIDVHSHPNEALGPFKYKYDNGQWGTNNPNNDRGPSLIDYGNVIARKGLYDIMVDDKNYYFYNADKAATITVSKNIFNGN